MNLHLNKRKNMTEQSEILFSGKKIVSIVLCLFIGLNLYADEKLDALELQSKEFFKAITGLEQDYIQEQMNTIQTKGGVQQPSTTYVQQPQETTPQLSVEEYSKNTFNHENEIARIKTDFTRTTKLKDLKIRSMYSFNGKDYAVLYLDDSTSSSTTKSIDEMSLGIDGRYKVGDYILSHKIVSINTRTKIIELTKDIDDENWYSIYINNHGVFVSDLKKRTKPKEEKKVAQVKEEIKKNEIIKEDTQLDKSEMIQEAFKDIKIKDNINANAKDCRYTVNISGGLNVRNTNNSDGIILRVLRNQDEFIAKQKDGDWIEIDTIYKKESGDVMVVKNDSNWVNIYKDNIISNCTAD